MLQQGGRLQHLHRKGALAAADAVLGACRRKARLALRPRWLYRYKHCMQHGMLHSAQPTAAHCTVEASNYLRAACHSVALPHQCG